MRFPLIVVSALFLSACQGSTQSVSASNKAPSKQMELCEANSFIDALNKCETGQMVSVLFNRWGNEQLPLVAASVVCDFDHSVIYNNSGVVCVFTKARYDHFLAKNSKAVKDAPSADGAKPDALKQDSPGK